MDAVFRRCVEYGLRKCPLRVGGDPAHHVDPGLFF